MNLNIPKSRMGFGDIDYNRTGESYGMMSDYVHIKGAFPLWYMDVEGKFFEYWFSDTSTVRYSVHEGGGEEVLQNKRATFEHGDSKYPAGVRPTIDYSFIINNGNCIQNTISKNIKICGIYDKELRYSIYQYGEYPQTAASNDENILLENLYKKNKLRKTGKSYTYVNREKNIDSFLNDEEYIYEGVKYVRAKVTYRGEVFNTNYGGYVWVKVEPINWIVDELNKTAICEKIIAGPMKYNDFAKDGIEGTFIENFLDNYLSKEISKSIMDEIYESKYETTSKNEINKKDMKNSSVTVRSTLGEWINWSNENNIHPLIHMFMIGTDGIYLNKNIEWGRVSDELYKSRDILSLSELLDEDVYNDLYDVYNSLNISVDDVINNNVCEENVNNLTNVKKYLLVTLLTLVDETNYEIVNKFIEEKLGKKYVKYYEKLYDQCLEKYKELSLGNNKKKRNLIPFLNRK